MTNWEKILGGYATGTLTGEERAALMHAALRDQDLFDVLMDEEALREALADPATRAALLRALDPRAVKHAWWRNPWPWTGLGAVAAALALFVILRPVDAPGPVRMAQYRPPVAAPEPMPVVIETPKQLKLSKPDAPGNMAVLRLEPQLQRQSAEASPEKKMMAMTPPAVPSPSPAASAAAPSQAAPTQQPASQAAPPPPPPQKEESAPARFNAPAAPSAMMAKQKAIVAAPAVEPLAVALSYQAEDGIWHALDLQSAVPANRPLRLKVTSARSGVLALQPPLAELRRLAAGIPNEISLPGQPAGTLRLRLALAETAVETLGRVGNELREVRPRTMADAAAPVAAPTVTREIRLRIE